ncbi:colicin E3/pyocin S6 family cytotoxin [Smaragdicoccus niigatensis]|uniref:colicin E3/pyocin S6 family cytotoxin n=1 Tax=Smaragdicoccus niigatensis TaxID=359359 RepID=UPI00039AD56D|nr:colicin E3/pyocin S6 family cytotoxin [Smaragdicoccus niigatensis]
MTQPLTVDTAVFDSAAEMNKTAHDRAQKAVRDLARALDAHWGCAGTDPYAHKWTTNYDPAAASAIKAATDLVNGFGKLHDLLAFTSVNHTNANRLASSPPQAALEPPVSIEGFAIPRFRGAYGGDTPIPFGWSAITTVAKDLTWPNGDPAELRKLSDAWGNAAQGLRQAADDAGPARAELESLDSPEIPQILDQVDISFELADILATRFEELARNCRDWAWDIEQAHRDIEKILAAAVAAAVIVGVGTALLSAGFATAAIESGVAAATGGAVAGVLAVLDGAAIASAAAAAGIGVAIAGAVTQIQPLLDAEPTVFEAVATGRGRTHDYVHAPDELEAFPNARNVPSVGPHYRTRWIDEDGKILEWDRKSGAVEKYTKRGVHLGEFDPITGRQLKAAKAGRKPDGF